MARPPRQIFQKARTKMAEKKEIIKKNTIKYFLAFYLISELFSFCLEHLNPIFYYEFGFNLIVQLQFFVLFIFLLKFNFCARNKTIIYSLLFYFLINAFLPFFATNDFYISIMKNIFIILLSGLLTLTLFKK